jgi:hypothetical protein
MVSDHGAALGARISYETESDGAGASVPERMAGTDRSRNGRASMSYVVELCSPLLSHFPSYLIDELPKYRDESHIYRATRFRSRKAADEAAFRYVTICRG